MGCGKSNMHKNTTPAILTTSLQKSAEPEIAEQEQIAATHPNESNETNLMSQYVSSTQKKDINEDYKISSVIGAGRFGQVRIGHYLHSLQGAQQIFAIKTVDKRQLKDQAELDQLKREVMILNRLDHPNIVKLYDVYEDARYFYMVMEMCYGGELFERIYAIGRYSEAQAASLMTQVLHAVSFLHQNGIAHRDLKPENFLFESSEKTAELKLIDFGLSNKFFSVEGQAMKMNTVVGSPYYVAPEVLYGKYGKECDVWSAGVILYILLSGSFPFTGQTNPEIFKAVITGAYNTSSGIWTQISEQAKDLIRQMLKIEPESRISAEDALHHPWFSNQIHDELQIDPTIITSLRQYRAKSKMQKEAMNVMVKYLEIHELRGLRQIFNKLDHTGSGTITAKELEEAMESVGIHAAVEEIQKIISNIDYLGNGEINYSEFLAATFSTKFKLTEAQLWSVFKRFDTDNSGFITKDNLEETLRNAGKELTSHDVEAMISEVDLAKDGQISFDEFKMLMVPDSPDVVGDRSPGRPS